MRSHSQRNTPTLPHHQKEYAPLVMGQDRLGLTESSGRMISSPQNPKIKRLLSLEQKSSERRKAGVFVVEGQRELMHCLEAGYEPESVFYCPELLERHLDEQQDKRLPTQLRQFLQTSQQVFQITPDVYGKIAYRDSTEGIIALLRMRHLQLEDLQMGPNPLLVVVESVEKPGNLGAILRSADAAGADAVIVCDPLTDLYNPNLIRASVGAAFSVPTIACTSEQCIAFLKQQNIAILTAQLQDSSLYYHVDMQRPTAIVMGTEATGLTQQWRLAADAHIRIPMQGQIDSLNVSVSAAILLFEAVRQRMNAAQ